MNQVNREKFENLILRHLRRGLRDVDILDMLTNVVSRFGHRERCQARFGRPPGR